MLELAVSQNNATEAYDNAFCLSLGCSKQCCIIKSRCTAPVPPFRSGAIYIPELSSHSLDQPSEHTIQKPFGSHSEAIRKLFGSYSKQFWHFGICVSSWVGVVGWGYIDTCTSYDWSTKLTKLLYDTIRHSECLLA